MEKWTGKLERNKGAILHGYWTKKFIDYPKS